MPYNAFTTATCHTLPLLPDSTLVESKLIPLKNIPIHTSTLPRSRRNDSIQPPSLELSLKRLIDLARRRMPSRLLFLHTLALLHRFLLLPSFLLLLPTSSQTRAIVRFIPLSEWSCVDLDHGALGEGVCADELVVGGMEGDGDDANFAGNAFGAPAEVPGVEAEGAVFVVAATGTDDVDAFGADTGVGRLTAFFKCPGWWSARDISR